MSDLLAIADCAGEEAIDRMAGLFRQYHELKKSAQTLVESTARRLEGMRWNAFRQLAELGEALLRVQESRPGEFEFWLQSHQDRLGFRLRTARELQARARTVREHGLDRAYTLQLEHPRKEPLISIRLELRRPIEDLEPEERDRIREKLRPLVHVLFPQGA